MPQPLKRSLAFAEDLPIGRTWNVGTRTLTTDEIVSFATQWDPLHFHVDRDLAAESFFGTLVASGIQSLAIFERLCVDTLFSRWAIQAGRGMRDLRFHQPVVAGMQLFGRTRIDQIDEPRHGTSLLHLSGELVTSEEAVVHSVGMDIYVRARPV